MQKNDKEIKIDVAPSIFDRVMSMGLDFEDVCTPTDDLLKLEQENEIYFTTTNHDSSGVDPSRSLHRRSTEAGNNNTANGSKTNSKATIRLIERLAVKTDELNTKIELATKLMNSPKVISNRELFLLYRQRMKTLLKQRLKLMIQEHRLTMDAYSRFEIPKHMHR